MSVAETASAVTVYLSALNAHDADAVAACVTEDFHNEHTSAIAQSSHGRAVYRQRLTGFLANFVDLAYEIEDFFVDGERAAVFYRLTFLGQSEDGERRRVAIRGVFRFVVRDCLIAHRIDYWDTLDYQRQIGEPSS